MSGDAQRLSTVNQDKRSLQVAGTLNLDIYQICGGFHAQFTFDFSGCVPCSRSAEGCQTGLMVLLSWLQV